MQTFMQHITVTDRQTDRQLFIAADHQQINTAAVSLTQPRFLSLQNSSSDDKQSQIKTENHDDLRDKYPDQITLHMTAVHSK